MSDRNTLRIASPPDRPIMIWDGQCGFCAHWVERWKRKTGTAVEYIPYQDLGERFPEIPVRTYRTAAHLIDPDGSVSTGARAAYRALAHGGSTKALWMYDHLPGYAALSEWGYRAIAKNRGFAFRITKWLVRLRLLK